MNITEKFENAAEDLGLDTATDRKEAEYDIVKSLLEAASFHENEDSIEEVKIKRNGKYLFTVHLHPLSDDEVRQARKKATIYAKNPKGPKYPRIEKDFDDNLFHSWLIYLATTTEDREKIWGNPAVKNKYGLMQNVDTIDALLRWGDKVQMIEIVSRISGLDGDEDEDDSPEEIAKK